MKKIYKNFSRPVNQYETEKDHQLFFWKEEEDIIGLMGILLLDNRLIQIQHISVNPSHRGKGVGKRMVKALKELHERYSFYSQ